VIRRSAGRCPPGRAGGCRPGSRRRTAAAAAGARRSPGTRPPRGRLGVAPWAGPRTGPYPALGCPGQIADQLRWAGASRPWGRVASLVRAHAGALRGPARGNPPGQQHPAAAAVSAARHWRSDNWGRWVDGLGIRRAVGRPASARTSQQAPRHRPRGPGTSEPARRWRRLQAALSPAGATPGRCPGPRARCGVLIRPGCPAGGRPHHPDSPCGERISSVPGSWAGPVFSPLRAVRAAHFDRATTGRYPSWTSMCIRMPAVLAERGWLRG
jgi:hypothetical protein